MDRIEKLPPGDLGGASIHSAFITLVTKDCTPFAGLSIAAEFKKIVCPVFLMQCRDDGQTGFFGGGVDKGETMEEGARREFYEETGRAYDGALELIASYLCLSDNRAPRSSHLFAAEVSFEFMLSMVKQIADHMTHDFGETYGGKLVATYLKNGGDRFMVPTMLAPMPPSTGEQILDLIGHYDLMNAHEQAFLNRIFTARQAMPVYHR